MVPIKTHNYRSRYPITKHRLGSLLCNCLKQDDQRLLIIPIIVKQSCKSPFLSQEMAFYFCSEVENKNNKERGGGGEGVVLQMSLHKIQAFELFAYSPSFFLFFCLFVSLKCPSQTQFINNLKAKDKGNHAP